MTVTRPRLVVLTVCLWGLACVAYGYYYVVSILASPDPYEHYVNNWQFQVMAFSMVRLPVLIMALPFVIIAALAIFELTKWRK